MHKPNVIKCFFFPFHHVLRFTHVEVSLLNISFVVAFYLSGLGSMLRVECFFHYKPGTRSSLVVWEGNFNNNDTFELGCSFKILLSLSQLLNWNPNCFLFKAKQQEANWKEQQTFCTKCSVIIFLCTRALQLIIEKKVFMENMCSFWSITLLQL